MDRITRARTSKGDDGYSEVLQGFRIPKKEDIYLAQCEMEDCLLDAIDILIDYEHVLDKEDLLILKELILIEFNNLGGNIYVGLNPEKFNFDGWEKYVPEKLHNLLLERLDYFSNKLENAPNFTIPSNRRESKISRFKVSVRRLEIYLWKIVYSLYFDPRNAPEPAKKIVATYNCLSDYIYQLNRYISYAYGNKEVYWEQ